MTQLGWSSSEVTARPCRSAPSTRVRGLPNALPCVSLRICGTGQMQSRLLELTRHCRKWTLFACHRRREKKVWTEINCSALGALFVCFFLLLLIDPNNVLPVESLTRFRTLRGRLSNICYTASKAKRQDCGDAIYVLSKKKRSNNVVI